MGKRGKPLSELSQKFIDLLPDEYVDVQNNTERSRIFTLAFRRKLKARALRLTTGGWRVYREAA